MCVSNLVPCTGHKPYPPHGELLHCQSGWPPPHMTSCRMRSAPVIKHHSIQPLSLSANSPSSVPCRAAGPLGTEPPSSHTYSPRSLQTAAGETVSPLSHTLTSLTPGSCCESRTLPAASITRYTGRGRTELPDMVASLSSVVYAGPLEGELSE